MCPSFFVAPSLSSRRMQSIRSGSHFASKAMGARSQEPRAKIFVADEIPVIFKFGIEHAHAKRINIMLPHKKATPPDLKL